MIPPDRDSPDTAAWDMDGLRARLRSCLLPGLRHLRLPEACAEPLARFGALLLDRNRVMNLTALKTPEEIASLHFLDSLSLLGLYPCKGRSLIDVGSGAGFPGLPLRIADPSVRLTLLDAQGKRVEFLREACQTAGAAEVSCVHARAEEYAKDHREEYGIAVSRAVAALPVLAELCLPLVRPDGAFLAMKSVNSDEELDSARRAIGQLGGAVERVAEYPVYGTDILHRLIVIRKIRPTPQAFPRPFAKIKKRPL